MRLKEKFLWAKERIVVYKESLPLGTKVLLRHRADKPARVPKYLDGQWFDVVRLSPQLLPEIHVRRRFMSVALEDLYEYILPNGNRFVLATPQVDEPSLDGYKKTTFPLALRAWDKQGKAIKCIYNSATLNFNRKLLDRSELVLHAGLMLGGTWFVEL